MFCLILKECFEFTLNFVIHGKLYKNQSFDIPNTKKIKMGQTLTACQDH